MKNPVHEQVQSREVHVTGCPEAYGKVERNDKTDSEEFYQGRHFQEKKRLENWRNGKPSTTRIDRTSSSKERLPLIACRNSPTPPYLSGIFLD